MRPLCACGRRMNSKRHDRCWKCRYDELWHLTEEEPREWNGPVPLPPEPTQAVPGSQEKMDVMMERIDAGFQAFHPNDFTWEKS